MKLRNLGYAALVAATAAVIAIGSAAPSEAKGKKKTAAPPPAHPICVMTDYHPVCAVKGGSKQTYVNSCYAANDGAKVVSSKACPAKKAAKPHKKKTKKTTKKSKSKK